MTAPLLHIAGLTVRFGGLTAVDGVDLTVTPREIVAVIGPNGAGKTTVFNAISGIYPPTSGHVSFAGAPLLRPLRKRHVLGFGLIGLLMGTGLMLFDANIDRMWAVTLKQNFRGGDAPFSCPDAWQSFTDYLGAKPHIEARLGRFQVVSHDGKTHHGSARTPEDAAAQLAAARLRGAAATQPSHRRHWLVFALGAMVGAAASAVMWRQSRRTTAWIARRGLARTFQNNRLFHNMTALENVQVALDRHLRARHGRALAVPGTLCLGLTGFVGLWRGGQAPSWLLGTLLAAVGGGALAYAGRLWHLGAFSAALRDADLLLQAEARELLAFVGLAAQKETLARHLAYGDQRRLEIARALATRPQLLLLDEPAAGMNPSETRALMQLIRAVRNRGIAVLLIEHDMKLVMEVSDRIAVLEYGRKIAEGTPAAIRANPAVIAAYLGQEEVG